MNSLFAILSHVEVCDLILSSTEFSLYQICHHTEFSLLLPFFFIKSYSIGNNYFYNCLWHFYNCSTNYWYLLIKILFTGIFILFNVNATLASYSTTRLVSIVVVNVLLLISFWQNHQLCIPVSSYIYSVIIADWATD